MAELVFGMNQSLDGYVDHDYMGAPGPRLFHDFVACRLVKLPHDGQRPVSPLPKQTPRKLARRFV